MRFTDASLSASACVPLASFAQRRERPPNLVLVDDQRWNTLGCMGNSIIETPNFIA
jgi:hypothetical protein